MASVLPRIVASKARQAVEAFELAGEISHPGEGGRAREVVVHRFLADLLPPDFGIDSGFVIDAIGGRSRQVDVVVFRRDRAPILDIGGVKHFMIESVVAAIEIKASARSRSVLQAAFDNIASVKALDRTNQGTNRIQGEWSNVMPDVFQHQVFGAVVAGTSMSYDSCLETFVEWIEDRPRTLWVNEYVDMRSFQLKYVKGVDVQPREHSSDPMSAEGVGGFAGSSRPWGDELPLASFGIDLLEFLRVTPIVQFQRRGYFSSTAVPMGKWFHFDADFGARGSSPNPDREPTD